MSLTKEFEQKLSLGETRICPKCGEAKDRYADFHLGTSMCKSCKRQVDMNRRVEGRPSVTNADLLAMVMKMAAKIDKLEKAAVKHGWNLSDDDEEPTVVKKPKNSSLVESESDVEEPVIANKSGKKKHKTPSVVDSESDSESSQEVVVKNSKSKSGKKKLPEKPVVKKTKKELLAEQISKVKQDALNKAHKKRK